MIDDDIFAERIAHFRRISGLPKRFEQSGFENYRVTQNKQKQNLNICKTYALQFHDRKVEGCNLIFTGKPGTGKTHLAAAIGNDLINQEYHVIFSSLINILRQVKETYRQNSAKTEQQIFQYFVKPDLLIIDEAGVQFGTDTEKIIIFELINQRYEKKLPMIVISNLNEHELTNIWGVRVIDRLKENSAFLRFDWESYRNKF